MIKTNGRAAHVQRIVGAAAEGVLEARGAQDRKTIFEHSRVPMVMVDARRRYVEVNRPARLWFRLGLEEMRAVAIGDLDTAPPNQAVEQAWARLLDVGCVTGRTLAYGGDGSRLELEFYGLANILPGLHLIAFAPADWLEHEPAATEADLPDASAALTPREIDVLALAADGLSGPALARELVLSPSTVRSHFANIYTKLGVQNRGGAVAKAMRLGMIE